MSVELQGLRCTKKRSIRYVCEHFSGEYNASNYRSEYFAKKQELFKDGELFLTALKEFNKKELLMRRMKRKNVKRFMKLTMGEYLEIVNQLINTETDAEIDAILRKL